MEDFQMMYAEGMLELECHPFAATNEIMDLDDDHQWPLTS